MSLIESVSGILVAKNPTLAQIQIGGITYNLSISISTFEKLPELDQPVNLLTHLHVKEDILNLFGFESTSERALFFKFKYY